MKKFATFGSGLKNTRIINNKRNAVRLFCGLLQRFLYISLIVIHRTKEMRLFGFIFNLGFKILFFQLWHRWHSPKPASVEHRTDNAQSEQVKQTVIPKLELFTPKQITQSAKVRFCCRCKDTT